MLSQYRAPSAERAGAGIAERFLVFFAANIRNPNTRIAYARTVRDFFLCTEQRGLTLAAIRPLHVAAYVEQLAGAAPTVKQHLWETEEPRKSVSR